MKQRITVEQINELTDEQKERLREWWKPEEGDFFCDRHNDVEINLVFGCGCGVNHGFHPDEYPPSYPLLSIGQMIAFLETKEHPTLHIDRIPIRGMQKYDRYDVFQQGRGTSSEETLCDALWEAVKKALQQLQE